MLIKTINLLPWRDQQRKARQIKYGRQLLGSWIVCLMLITMVHVCLASSLAKAHRQLSFINGKLQGLSDSYLMVKSIQQQQKNLLADLKFMQVLQKQHALLIELLVSITKITPVNLFLEAIYFSNGQLQLLGRAETSSTVAMYLSHLNQIKFLKSVKLIENKIVDPVAVFKNQFEIKAQIHYDN